MSFLARYRRWTPPSTSSVASNWTPPIPVRIGLHIGDIVHDRDGVHGDGVNVAARVQGLAVPGSVLISGGVYEELKNHPRLPTRALGDFELKNAQRPLSIHAVAASALAVPSRADLSSSGNRAEKSIAVLPFVNMSSDLENEYFTDGITEEILNALVKFDDLKVTARTSSFVFKERNEDVREIGGVLNVGAVLEGSVRKAGNRVRITAQLVDTADGYHLFSNTYDRVLEDIFAVQDEIARTIAGELRVLFPVAGAQTTTTMRKPTESSEAYSLYLRGLHCWNQFTPDTTQEALRHFRDALALDPDFALAHTGIARCYIHLGAQGRLRSEEAYPAAQEAAQRAIELDPEIAMGHVSLGMVRLFFDWDLAGARSCLERAIELNSGSAEARHWAGYCYMASGHFDEFLETAQVAASLDPLSLLALDLLGTANIFAGNPRESLIHYDRALEIKPTFRTAIEGRALAYDRLGEHDRAIEEFLRYQALTPGGVGGLGTRSVPVRAGGPDGGGAGLPRRARGAGADQPGTHRPFRLHGRPHRPRSYRRGGRAAGTSHRGPHWLPGLRPTHLPLGEPAPRSPHGRDPGRRGAVVRPGPGSRHRSAPG